MAIKFRKGDGLGPVQLQRVLAAAGACDAGRALAKGRTLAAVWRNKNTQATYLVWWLINGCGITREQIISATGLRYNCGCQDCLPAGMAVAIRVAFHWDGTRKKVARG